jgi:hypothetical protein
VWLHHPGAFAVARGYQIPSQQAQKVGAACSHFSRTRKVPPKKWVGVDSPFSSVFLSSPYFSLARALPLLLALGSTFFSSENGAEKKTQQTPSTKKLSKRHLLRRRRKE